MKRSTCVQLVLLGSAMGLYGRDDATQYLKQQRYTSLDECRHDWGDPADCKQAPGYPGQSGYYFGPRYYWDPSYNRPVAVSPDGTTRAVSDAHISSDGSHFGGVTSNAGTFSRGGFGSSARGFGSGRG